MSTAKDAGTGSAPFFRAGMANIAIGLLSAVANYLSLLLIASYFGSGMGSDTYFFTLSLTTIATSLFASVLGTVFMPLLVELRHQSSREQASRFASVVLSWCTLLSLALCLYIYARPDGFLALFSRFTEQQIAQRRELLAYLPAIVFTSVLAEYFRILAVALGRYVLAAVGALFQPVLLVLAIALFCGSYGAACLPASLLAAKCLALLFGIGLLRNQGIRLRPVFKSDQVLTRFLKTSLPYWAASLVTNYSIFYFDYVATGLPQGTLTSLTFAQRIFALPTTIFILPLLEISRARFAEHRASGEEAAFQGLYNQLLVWIVYLTVPVTALFLLYPYGLVSALLGAGAYTPESIGISADCLRVYALSVLLTSVFMLNGRCIESFQRLGWPSLFGTLGNLAMIALTFGLASQWGYIGIPSARLCVDALYFLPMGFLFIRHFGVSVDLAALGGVAWRSVLACLPLVLFCQLMGGGDGLSRWQQLAVVAALFASYGAILLTLDNSLRQALMQLLKNRPQPARPSNP